jgi:hypothetical protein
LIFQPTFTRCGTAANLLLTLRLFDIAQRPLRSGFGRELSVRQKLTPRSERVNVSTSLDVDVIF